MAFIHLAIYLAVAAIVIAVVKPTSKKHIWLYSVLTPVVLTVIHTIIRVMFDESVFSNAAVMGQATGSSLTPIIVTFIILYICLEGKFNKKENYKYPKWLLVLIVILIAFGSYVQYLHYQTQKGIQDYIETRYLNHENNENE